MHLDVAAPDHGAVVSTIVGASLLRMDDQIGRVAPGYFADLLLVNGNPLDDLSLLASNGRDLAAIMRGGEFVKREL